MDTDTDSDQEDGDPPPKRYRVRPFVEFDRDSEFQERFCFTRRQVEHLLRLVGPHLRPRREHATFLSPEQKLLCALRFYASNGFYYTIGDTQGPSKASMCRAVKNVTYVINNVFNGMICWPHQEQECRAIAAMFARKADPVMPNVCGAMDGTLVSVTAPREFEANYVDRHGNHSINVLAVSDTQGHFLFLARWPGSVHDARVFRNSALHEAFEGGYRPFPNAVLLADSAFPASDYIVPMRAAATDNLARFYSAHARTRVAVEQHFGIWKNRLQCLKSGLRVSDPVYAASIIKACAYHQNFIVRERTPDEVDDHLYADPNLEEEAPDEAGVPDNVNNNGIARLLSQIASFNLFNGY